MSRRRRSDVHGVLVVDKPRGPTSHDVVAWARRALGTRSIGHAGTLDPMATGVLVLAVGEGTKLVRWLTADDKAYVATLALGAETDTLDAEGEVVERAEVPPLDDAEVQRIAAGFLGVGLQQPPVYSAIRVDGQRLHEAARRGEDVEVPEREVRLDALEVSREAPDRLELELSCAKGFYVRSLGRDLARALGTVGHLVALRRTASGPFTLADALDGEVLRAAREDDDARRRVRGAMLPLLDACRAMPRIALDPRQVADARHGRPIAQPPPEAGGPYALLDGDGALIAIGDRAGDGLRVVRGLHPG